MSFLKSFPPPGPAEGLLRQQPDTEAVLNGKGLGTGTLYIAESRLSWLDGSGLGFSLEYPTISLHALSRDRSDCLGEHLYVMVNAKFEEQGQGDIPTFYTYEEGLSHLTAEGQATLERLEGMLSQSVSSQYNMAGVRTEDSVRDYEDGMEVDTTPTVAGQFEDADVDH
ncbi:methylosome subunit pICln isoform X4 [Symphalangus syndactylus]|uniref:Methylosome subunit pICln n=2 Tax=Catarrhini TaxID=9526 RepID=A0A2I3HZP4_NOMLE|nr:methylosome subunit pICln isoform X4 [Symphalangus syndactylus]